jgi:serine/threonine-protein kinase
MSGDSLIGRTLGERFTITSFIGEGAMATVYRGTQSGDPPDVALKIMHGHLVGDPTFVARFRREAKAAAQIHHPNTVQVIDCGVDGNLVYIAMELLAGQDLFEALVLERRFAEQRAVRIVIEVCDALIAAHDKGIVHRDLKPENIMLVEDPSHPDGERVKVLDFGIAKILDRDSSPSSDGEPPSNVLTVVGMVVGTPAYMSPEQCRGEPIDVRSDIYACGILLYQLITGRLPFSGDHPMELALKHVRTPPPPPRAFMPAFNADLEALILRALSKWPAQRQQSAVELKAELARVYPALASRAHDPPLSTPAQPSAFASFDEAPLSVRSAQALFDPEAVASLRSSEIPGTLRAPGPRRLGGADPRTADTLATTLAATPSVVVSEPVIRISEPGPPLPESSRVPDSNDPDSGGLPFHYIDPQKAAAAGLPLAVSPPVSTARRPTTSSTDSSWGIVIISLLVGIGLGLAAYFLSSR